MGRREGQYGVSRSEPFDSFGNFPGVCGRMSDTLSADVWTVQFRLWDGRFCMEDFILRNCGTYPDGAYGISLVWSSAVFNDSDKAALQAPSFRYDANIGDNRDDHFDDFSRSGRTTDDALHRG